MECTASAVFVKENEAGVILCQPTNRSDLPSLRAMSKEEMTVGSLFTGIVLNFDYPCK